MKKFRKVCAAETAYTTDKLIDIIQSWKRMIDNSEHPEATLSDLKASINSVLKKAGVTAACSDKKKSVKAATSGDMLEDIKISKDAYIQQWQKDYDGKPNTSWDNIFDNVVNEFELYCDDEASSHVEEGGMYGKTIKERYDDGEIDAEDVENEFDEWTIWLDLNEYDY